MSAQEYIEKFEFEGKSPEDALQKALEQLKLSKDKLCIEVLSEGAKGLFGMPGNKPAKIRVSVKK